MKWNTGVLGKEDRKSNSRRKEVQGGPGYDYFFFCFALRNWNWELGKSRKHGGKNKEITLPTSERI